MEIPKLQFDLIPADRIRPNPFQPREAFEKESLKELADSIKEAGIIQPIIVRRHGKGFQIIAGERRWRALQMAGVKKIPAIIKDTAEDRVLLESLIENLHRLDLADVERENAIHELWKSGRFKSKADLAKALGITETRAISDIDAKELRERERLGRAVSTEAIRATRGLKEEERKRVIERVSREEIGVREAWTVSKVLKRASEPLKKELLKPKSPITPRMAETILEKLPSKEEQEAVVKEAKQYRLTEEEVEDRIRDIQRAKQKGVTPTVEMATIVQGQWLMERIEKPIEQLLTVNINAFDELSDKQKERAIDLLTRLQDRIQEWLLRLRGTKVLDLKGAKFEP